ncbi:MAG TPA: SRPBCC family protein [Pseudonocardia sp.]|jgi:uncharacterized protein YndB with AHSA1/START domain|uniref:SRPBCC family protein n=1 Tax=Pseudonocardia sp. TaxID=60912 RepID=UPI002B4AB7E6|nr:SRPBCC family protein [Pseudonocardia sp.]HLU55846.1 SRPBCC family protein [Pseudonocardia sp.]
MFDVDPQISAVDRRLGSRERDGREAKVVTISQAFDTDVEDLWQACTTAERLARWFAPVSGDLRLGGRYRIEGNAEGTVERCDPPERFSLTWEFGGGVSWVEVRLSPEPGGGARLELDHIAHPEDHWAVYGPGAVGLGYDMAFASLARHLATGEVTNDRDNAGWWASDEGKGFLAAAGDRWYEADVAGGADPESARDAADRTVEAYTG